MSKNLYTNIKSLKRGCLLTYKFHYQTDVNIGILLDITKDYNFHYILRVLYKEYEDLIPLNQIEILSIKNEKV